MELTEDTPPPTGNDVFPVRVMKGAHQSAHLAGNLQRLIKAFAFPKRPATSPFRKATAEAVTCRLKSELRPMVRPGEFEISG